jgi:putative nucleotidyltransferase with HDIG domain
MPPIDHWDLVIRLSMDRASALALMHEYTESLSLRRHMLAVEAAMRAYARRFGEDEEKWGLVGLLHDFDYERWPDPPNHPLKGAVILAASGYPADLIYAIKSHADYLPDCPRVNLMDKALYACDELAGFVTACAMVRPDRLSGMQASSVTKKLKAKAFAASINRDDIARGATDLGVELDQHIQFVIDAMQPIAGDLGLAPS